MKSKKILLIIVFAFILLFTGCGKSIKDELDENNQNLTGTSGVKSKRTASGMAHWAENAYMERWDYSWGSASIGKVDNSGLIFSYVGSGSRISEEMLSNSSESGPISSMPDIPGLGVYMNGHVGVYVGGGMVIDARNEDEGIVRSSISSSPWNLWFEIPGIEYDNK